jgi:ankyrin repeat protein
MIFGAAMALAMFVGSTQVDAAPIHDAALAGNVAAIQQELNNNVDVNAKDRWGWTALMLAARRGHSAVVEQLLNVPDIDVNYSYDDNTGTALVVAVREGRTSIVDRLLQVPDIDVKRKFIYTWGLHPFYDEEYDALSVARDKKHSEIVQLLEEHIKVIDNQDQRSNKTKSARK